MHKRRLSGFNRITDCLTYFNTAWKASGYVMPNTFHTATFLLEQRVQCHGDCTSIPSTLTFRRIKLKISVSTCLEKSFTLTIRQCRSKRIALCGRLLNDCHHRLEAKKEGSLEAVLCRWAVPLSNSSRKRRRHAHSWLAGQRQQL